MPSAGAGALGSLEYPVAERRKLAKKSVEWKCKQCGARMKDVLKPLTEDAKKSNEEAKELAAQLSFKNEDENRTPTDIKDSSSTSISPSLEAVTTATEAHEGISAAHWTPTSSPDLETLGLLEDHRNNYNGISLFVTLPICMIFLSLFGLLLVRRFLL